METPFWKRRRREGNKKSGKRRSGESKALSKAKQSWISIAFSSALFSPLLCFFDLLRGEGREGFVFVDLWIFVCLFVSKWRGGDGERILLSSMVFGLKWVEMSGIMEKWIIRVVELERRERCLKWKWFGMSESSFFFFFKLELGRRVVESRNEKILVSPFLEFLIL